MGSRTNGMHRKRERDNVVRLTTKLAKGKVLTAKQHAYLEDFAELQARGQRGQKRGKRKLRSKHRCDGCGTGGHRRGSFLETSVTGVGIRV